MQTGPVIARAASRCSGSSEESTSSGVTGPVSQVRRTAVARRAPGRDRESGVLSEATHPMTRGARMSDQLTIYSTQWCGYCHRLMKQLDREGVVYVTVDIENDPVAADFVMSVNGGNQTVPTVVFTDGSALTNPSLAQVKERLAA
jgi:mycoredoxin